MATTSNDHEPPRDFLYGDDIPTPAHARVDRRQGHAVLPCVAQGAVEQQQGWLGGDQMIDSLALGESTPGPLIMVVPFLSSFLFFLVGGPVVEASRGELRLQGPLTAIIRTTAAVRMIANLALFFAGHLL
ncbi:chromate transporter [Synechococcus sp. RedBA-s]|uniref:chromate transporter n=1 Tax=Synechococcus sp. RedBA-s TaxID=2823741 RepID=UPI0020CCCE5A|nr:chromate transporter [Synechococcus sp. RedBA-s]MCP9799367.1 chromate transporter [Synechococcus sp. RedBA-s]